MNEPPVKWRTKVERQIKNMRNKRYNITTDSADIKSL